MPISFGGKPKEDDVVSLIAAKKYARAIEVLKTQLQKKGANPSLRMQLADVLILAEKKTEAIALLLPLADQYANEGFAAKAVSVLKKVQKIDPGRRDVDSRLARVIQEKQREAMVLPLSRPGQPFDLEEAPADDGAVLEIGFSMGSISVSAPSAPVAPVPVAAPPPAAPARPEPVRVPPVKPAPVLAAEPVAMLPAEPVPALRAEPLPTVIAKPLPLLEPQPAPVLAVEPLPVLEAEPLPVLEAEPLPVLEAEPLPVLEAEPLPVLAAEPLPVLEAEPVEPLAVAVVAGESAGIEDYDLLYAGDDSEDDIPLAAEVIAEDEEAAEPMSAGQFADELMSLVDSVFQESAAGAPAATATAPAAPMAAAPRSGTQIVVSPLFRDFSVDEMVAVIEGLKLLGFERGDVILREGQPGGSLYMLTSGRARAFKKDPATSKQVPIGDLEEGAFFGEMSILTGHPRAASVVALSRCELLELDRSTLDGITQTHPHVWDVLREFAEKRAAPARR